MSPSPNSPVPTLTTQPSIYSPQPVYHPNLRSPSLHSRALSDFQSTSKASSLRGPPLTRDPSSVASNSTTGYLPTPTDDVMHTLPPLSRCETTLTSYYRNQAFHEQTGQHSLNRKDRVAPTLSGPRTRPVSVKTNSPTSPTQLVASSGSMRDVSSSSEGGNLTQGSVLTPPRMERQHLARDLISRYEDLELAAKSPVTPNGSHRLPGRRPCSGPSISQTTRRELSLPSIPPSSVSPARSQGGTNNPPHALHSYCLPESPSYFSFARKGGKLRNSFTNLVQLFGDKARSKDNAKKRNSVSPSETPSRSLNALPKGFKLRLSKRSSPGSSPSSSPGKAKDSEKSSKILPDISELLESEPIISTLLLYQSPVRQIHPSIPDQKTPLWMPYTVSLYPGTIILQVPNPGLSSSSKFQIPLSELYDVHSTAAKDLPPGSIPPPGSTVLPPGFECDMYVFEAQCYGGRIERFATPTMALRTTWVRYLLDVLAGKNPDPNYEVDASNKLKKGSALTPRVVPYSPTGIRHLPSISSLGTSPLATESLPNPTSLVGDMATTYSPNESVIDSNPSIEEYPPPALMRLSTPTKSLSRIVSSRPGDVCGVRQVASAFTNPWDPPATPSQQPTSIITQRTSSLLMTARSDRSGMTASPSICRLDERNLVRDRLAVFERQNSPSLRGRESIRSRGKEGSVNWEALSEIRAGRGASGLSRTTCGVPSPVTRSPLGTSSPVATHIDNKALFTPMWLFPEPTTPGSARVSSSINSKPNAPTLGPGASFVGLAAPCSDSVFITTPGKGRQEASTPLLPLSTNRTTKPKSKPTQLLGNLPPSNNIGINPLELASRPVEVPTPPPSLQLILDRLNTLTSALRESDVVHSTKTSGLGQLIASTQDHIAQIVEDSTRLATAEHITLVGHIEGLRGMVELLVAKPLLGAEERTNLLSIKETIVGIDQVISTRLEGLSGDLGRETREEMKLIIAEQTDELKHIIQDLALKLDWASTQNDVLAKLDTPIKSMACASSAWDMDLMTEFVQQIKSHISPLPTPNSEPPNIDISSILEKLDTLSNPVNNLAILPELSTIQATLEDIRDLSQVRQTLDLAPAPATSRTDMSEVLKKLDSITVMCQSIMEVRAEALDPEVESKDAREAQQMLLNVLKEDGEHRTAQARQTAELVRYSNELNTWLEKFVMNASTLMDGVGAGIGALRHDLGLGPPPLANGQEDLGAPPQGVIQELRVMFEEQVKSAADIAASLNKLLVAFNEDQARNLQARENLATDSVLKMIEVQRQEQERLLKQLASDLSSDIRGERIRFVEAMSQATSMNVQLHVEEFKKQLTHEVLALTDEVGRLREERKTIQHQIAQLFLVKSEHEAESLTPDAPRPPPRLSPSTRPNGR
ncbi:hypothetical protein OPQ81_005510 [Rhizoctonia solani]|nr:hypothetical protein OPQ81_005510 [Rhizoctonia solani]